MLEQFRRTRRGLAAECHWPIGEAALSRWRETQNGDIGVAAVRRDALKGAFHYFPPALENLSEPPSGEQQGPGKIIILVAIASHGHNGAEFSLQARFSHRVGRNMSDHLAAAVDKPVK